ncbi:hypothetical protein NDA11_000072 [Ustilago hordei]|nr:hypothetical protein NDA12_007581 [Ustilago hordei]KAJ1589384.1 hypothetical protein NDA15_004964 [Ustilago hordei]KAJ1590506.1 hypothetical protein NDA11_000072 [Ustilago hordei]
MASTSSLGSASLIHASSAQAFYTHFSADTTTLLDQLGSVSDGQGLQGALQSYARLGAQLTAAVDSGVLPAHDQALHRRRLRELAVLLEDTRPRILLDGPPEGQAAGGNKKRGFAFKRTQQPKAATPAVVETTQSKRQQPTPIQPSPTSNHITITALDNTCYTCSEQSESKPLSLDLHHISNSLVDLRSSTSQHTVLSAQLGSITNSILLLPPIEGSLMIHNLTNSLLSIPSCHQFRMHASNTVLVELSTKRGSVLTLEACSGVKFLHTGPMAGAEAEGLRVQDFDDLIHTCQLKHHLTEEKGVEGGRKRNFQVVKAAEAGKGMADKVDHLLRLGSSVKQCLEKMIDIPNT